MDVGHSQMGATTTTACALYGRATMRRAGPISSFPAATTAATPRHRHDSDRWKARVDSAVGQLRRSRNQNETGYIYAAISFDEGDSWSAPHRVDGFYRVHDGVSIEANDAGQCWYSFVWAGEKGIWEYGQNKLRTRACTISPAGIVTAGAVCIQSQHSRVAPDLAWHTDTGTFVQGFREQDLAHLAELDAYGRGWLSCWVSAHRRQYQPRWARHGSEPGVVDGGRQRDCNVVCPGVMHRRENL